MYPREFEKGSYVIREGDAGMIAKFEKKRNFYLVSLVV
jgi:hypothetical protein